MNKGISSLGVERTMVTLFRKKGNLEVNLPKNWQVLQTIFKEGEEVRRPLSDLIERALDHPVDSRPLEEMLKPGIRLAIVVDDVTRPTPVRELLPPLLRRIHQCGVPKKDVDIVIGVGTHRPLSQEEIRERCGKEVAKAYRIQNHDARSRDLIRTGEVPGYGPVSMNATVIQADVKITLGSILPHVHNGFGGGPKSVMPGICDFETIRHHHLKNVVDHRSILGNITDNPFYKDCCQIARLALVNFSINCLFDSLGQVVGVLAGNLFAVHDLGIRKTREALGVLASGRSDITIVSSFPYDEGPQIVKPVLPAAMVTKPGGTIFLLAEISTPLPEFFLESFSKIRDCGGEEAESRIREKLRCVEPIIEGPMDFNMALVLIFFVSRKYRVVLIADKVLQQAALRMGFNYAPDLLSAIEGEKMQRENPTVNIIPAGGYIFPLVTEGFRLMDT
jgi:nickel-dependent lactate racemase